MAQVMIISLFFLYGVLTVPSYAQDDPFPDCTSITNAPLDKNYELTVNPTSYKANLPYSVTIKGPISNTAILFQVTSSPNNYVKTGWEGGNPSCNGIYFQTTADETSLTKSWTSPTDTAVTSVTISAYVKTADNKISMATIDLSNGDSTTPPTTVATTATTRDTTSATISTTSSASTLLSSYTILGIIQVMALVFLCHLTS